ncbi:MAG TPA: helix-turn-helix transcriptional regulator [Acidobacteriota bacterium]
MKKDRSQLISKLKDNKSFRAAYIRAKLNVLVPSQIRALRLKSERPRQEDLAREVEMKQSRISAMETPGATNFTLETLIRLASVFRVGLMVKFVPFSEMLGWENEFSQDTFKVATLDEDTEFTDISAYREVIQGQLDVKFMLGIPIQCGVTTSTSYEYTIPLQHPDLSEGNLILMSWKGLKEAEANAKEEGYRQASGTYTDQDQASDVGICSRNETWGTLNILH